MTHVPAAAILFLMLANLVFITLSPVLGNSVVGWNFFIDSLAEHIAGVWSYQAGQKLLTGVKFAGFLSCSRVSPEPLQCYMARLDSVCPYEESVTTP
jgi:hypothetical protein